MRPVLSLTPSTPQPKNQGQKFRLTLTGRFKGNPAISFEVVAASQKEAGLIAKRILMDHTMSAEAVR